MGFDVKALARLEEIKRGYDKVGFAKVVESEIATSPTAPRNDNPGAFVGVGIVVLGALAFAGVIALASSLPLLLPLMIPLFIVWLFCAMLRKGKGTEKGD